MLVPQNQAELYTSIPTLRWLLVSIFVALFEIERREVDVVSKREQQNSPSVRSTLFPRLPIRICQITIPHTMDAHHIRISGPVSSFLGVSNRQSPKYVPLHCPFLNRHLLAGLEVS